MHYYQFNIGDYASATAHLEPLEDLAYRRMLDLYYSSEKPLPNDIERIARLIRMRTHTDCIASVLREYFSLEDDNWHCERVDVEIFKFQEKSTKASKSAKARWRKQKAKQKVKASCEGNANALKTQSDGNANHKPLTTNQEPLTTNQLKDTAPAKAGGDTLEIFNYWKEVMNKGASTKLNKKREKLIKDRLNDGYPVEEIEQAIFNCSRSAFHMGQNDNQTKYNDIDLICRPDKFEQFRDNVGQQQVRQFSQAAEKTINNIINVELD